MKKLIFIFMLIALVFQSSCGSLGIIAVLGMPSSHEKKVTAEYGLADSKSQKILVLVNQGVWLNADVNLCYYLTEAVNEELQDKVKIGPDHLISYSKLAEIRSKQPGLTQLSPVELAAALDADMVLLVELESYGLNELPEGGYYKGYLNARAVLLETAPMVKLWPESERAKFIKVGFDVESGGKEAAVVRLANALAYGIVRHLYNCPKDKFKFADDRSGAHWQDWE
jgi:hypothetical protein